MPTQALDAGLIKQISVVFHQQVQRTVALDPFEGQIKLGRGTAGAIWRHAQPRHLHSGTRSVL